MKSDNIIPINRSVLSNGLRLVHHYIPDSAMVTLDVMYNVGARDEDPEMTGIAHLFEHLMFGGSVNVPDFDGVLTAAGGVSNAWTSNDFTNFYETAPAHNAETLFYLESDRMLTPLVSDETLEVQRSVVIEEFKQQCLNQPYGNTMHTLRPMVYGEHPYSWPVIGKDFEALRKVTRADVIDWWTRNYSPGNAVLAVTGNITWEQTLEYAQKWFGTIPAREVTPKAFPVPEPLTGTKVMTVRGAVPATMINIAYVMDRFGTFDYYVADALTDILAAGQASLFYQRINMNPESPIVDAEASISGSEDRGMLMLSARLAREDVDVEEATQFLLDAARAVIVEGVSEHELQRLKNRRHSMFVMTNMSGVVCAQTIAEAEIHNEDPGRRLEIYNSITAEDIVRVAKHFFNDSHRAVLYYRPQND